MSNLYKQRIHNNSVYVVAELSANHGQSLDNAILSVQAARECGADAIKVQTYTPDTLTINCDNDFFRIKHGTIWDGSTLYELYKEAFTPWEWHGEICNEALRQGLDFFSTPFDVTAVDFLEEMGVEIYKIASFEITDIPLVEYVASKGKPVLISTGIATLADIEEAVCACKRAGNSDVTLLKCTSSYPADPEDANLLTIPNLAETFSCRVGISDHTMGHAVAVAAVALGAKVVEKHFILDRSIGGPDSLFSMTPGEFTSMVANIRVVEKALGRVSYDLTQRVEKQRMFARSLFVVKDMQSGDVITAENVRSIRPGYGLAPRFLPSVIGKKVKEDVSKGTPLSFEIID
ncbi:pseudaminic acid synthase [Desulfogranum mediterraneum]|uniref:pseudaminic acid synthase n=1 Tax=Desulfogranum mediterraneum TaxID=160661 RepID=UPI000428B3D3